MEFTELQINIIIECAEDEVGIWDIVREVTEFQYDRNLDLPDFAKKQVLEFIDQLLSADLIEAGNPNGPTFLRLSGTRSEIIEYIDQEWKKLGKQPHLGDVCWFRATPKGKQVAEGFDR